MQYLIKKWIADVTGKEFLFPQKENPANKQKLMQW